MQLHMHMLCSNGGGDVVGKDRGDDDGGGVEAARLTTEVESSLVSPSVAHKTSGAALSSLAKMRRSVFPPLPPLSS